METEKAVDRVREAISRLEAQIPVKHVDRRGTRKPPERKRKRLEAQASRRANRKRK